MKIALIRERKNPPDKRVVLSPQAAKKAVDTYPDLEIIVEKSPIRAYKDEEYAALGLELVDDITSADVLLGVKEVPIPDLIPNKKYFFFSHTIKKQPYNRGLLQAILAKNIEMHDHEVLTDQKEKRVVAFGRYAGIVGAYNGFRTYGLKYDLFELPKAEFLDNQQELIAALAAIKTKLPNIKIVLTGKGRVSNGAKEMLNGMGLQEVSSSNFLNKSFDTSIYTQLGCGDYVKRKEKRKDGQELGISDFYKNPQDYESTFMRYAKVADMYISGHFYADGAPYFFTREDIKNPDFNIKVVADVSCDIDGPVACTIKPSTIADPIYGYNPITEQEDDFKKPDVIAVMAVDNLPCELPKDASTGFGKMFEDYVLPAFFNNDETGILQRSLMTKDGKLTERFSYLEDYVAGKA